MKNKAYLLMMVMIVALTSCSGSDNESAIDTVAGQINMSATIEELSPRSATNILSERFAVNNRIAVYIKEHTSESPSMIYDQPLEYRIIDTNGSMAPVVGKAPYYPVNGNDVVINAFFPYTVAIGGSTYTLGTSQLTKADYEACDIMSSSYTGKEYDAPVNLMFRHLATKITYNLSTSQTNVKLSYSKVRLLNIKREANIDAIAGTINSVSGANDTPVLISNNGAISGSAIILPQSISANTRFFEIELATGEIVYGVMPAAYTFEAGKSYVFNIDIIVDRQASEVTLSNVQIVDWVDEYSTPQDIDGDIQD